MALTNRLAIRPLNPTIGAVVAGVDVRDDPSPGLVDDLRAALLAHQVLFFEDQEISPTQQRDFAAHFGDLHTHPLYPGDETAPEIMVLDNHAGNPSDNDNWHTDVTFLQAPAMGAMLYARLTPPAGGDTLWSSMTAAYRGLSAPMQQFLSGL